MENNNAPPERIETMKQRTLEDFITPCGLRFGWQANDLLIRSIGNHCPNCGHSLAEDYANIVHDGYHGSPHAHDGAGSLGLALHHYFIVCPECATRAEKCECEACVASRRTQLQAALDQCAEEGGWLVRASEAGKYAYSVVMSADEASYWQEILLPGDESFRWVAVEDLDPAGEWEDALCQYPVAESELPE